MHSETQPFNIYNWRKLQVCSVLSSAHTHECKWIWMEFVRSLVPLLNSLAANKSNRSCPILLWLWGLVICILWRFVGKSAHVHAQIGSCWFRSCIFHSIFSSFLSLSASLVTFAASKALWIFLWTDSHGGLSSLQHDELLLLHSLLCRCHHAGANAFLSSRLVDCASRRLDSSHIHGRLNGALHFHMPSCAHPQPFEYFKRSSCGQQSRYGPMKPKLAVCGLLCSSLPLLKSVHFFSVEKKLIRSKFDYLYVLFESNYACKWYGFLCAVTELP